MQDTDIKPVKHQFGAEVSKVLKLVIHSLYRNKDIFLRELISNASDACDKLRFNALTNSGLLGGEGEFYIMVAVNPKDSLVTITDNGIGMDAAELEKNLGTIAKSGTEEFAKAMEKGAESGIDLIGQFGVGFYSAFMVADEVKVESVKAGSDKCNVWRSKGEGEFTIESSQSDIKRGTRITLAIKESEKEFLDKFRLQHIITTYSDHIAYPIKFIDEEGKEEIVNSRSAIWARPKSEITEEQYQEFYRHVAHSIDKPWMVIHNKNEGAIEYTNLLFIPSMKPFDLFHPDRLRRVKLYSRKVFITDEGIDLVPHWLRFLRGIVDSEDLPLNVSREAVQNNPLIDKIRSGIVKKVLSELKKKAEKDGDDYNKFIENFGAVLKEGLCEVTSPREEILEVCRFESAANGKLISLDEYIKSAKEGQTEVFYLTAESLDEAKQSPLLEGFTSKGYDVLLLTDHVDDFWVSAIPKYKEFNFTSITRSGINLEEGGDKGKETAVNNGDKPVDSLVDYLGKFCGESVKKVVKSGKLAEIPAILSVEEGQLDIRFEKFLLEQNQIRSKAPKVLEINPSHPVIKLMSELFARQGDTAELAEMAGLLLDQARIMAGEDITDRKSFARRLNTLLEAKLAA